MTTPENPTTTRLSDNWFAENAVNAEARKVQGSAETIGGSISVGLEVVNAVQDIGLTGISIYGLDDITSGLRHHQEARLARSTTAKEAKDHAENLKWLNVASAFPMALMATAMTGNPMIGVTVGLAYGVFRYLSARSAEQQVNLIASPETAARSASESWFKSNTLRELPQNFRFLERYMELFKTLGHGGYAVYALVSLNPIFAILYAMGAGYSWWKYSESLPPVIDYYGELHKETKRLIEA